MFILFQEATLQMNCDVEKGLRSEFFFRVKRLIFYYTIFWPLITTVSYRQNSRTENVGYTYGEKQVQKEKIYIF